jgi:hypothetical protein
MKKLNKDTKSILKRILLVLFQNVDNVKIKDGEEPQIVFITKGKFFFNKRLKRSLSSVLLFDIPNMMSQQKWANHSYAPLYLIKINEIIKPSFMTPDMKITEIVNYLYSELFHINVRDISDLSVIKMMYKEIPKETLSKNRYKLKFELHKNRIREEKIRIPRIFKQTDQGLLVVNFQKKKKKLIEDGFFNIISMIDDSVKKVKYKAAVAVFLFTFAIAQMISSLQKVNLPNLPISEICRGSTIHWFFIS